ncbi:MAG: OmpH family outer membrane protein, partial [Bacteroidota bacterium]
AQIQQEATSLEQTLEELQVEYNNKLEQYLADREKLSQVIIQNKEAELQSLQQRIQNFEASASQSIQELRAQLFQPVLDKANKAISDVAQEKGYTYVFDSSTGVLIYMSENAIDILPDVKAKLGL